MKGLDIKEQPKSHKGSSLGKLEKAGIFFTFAANLCFLVRLYHIETLALKHSGGSIMLRDGFAASGS